MAALGLRLKVLCAKHSLSGGVAKPEPSLELLGAILSSKREALSGKTPDNRAKTQRPVS